MPRSTKAGFDSSVVIVWGLSLILAFAAGFVLGGLLP